MCTGHAQIFSVNELELDSWALQYIYLSICPNKFLDTEYVKLAVKAQWAKVPKVVMHL